MNNVVQVQADKNGGIIRVSYGNPEYGYIRVVQESIQVNNEGWLKQATRSAFIKGKISDLEAANYKDGEEISGKIVIKESLKPFNDVMPDKHLKIAGDTGIVCRFDDQPIYRQSFFTKNFNIDDEFINHTNSDEIKNVQKAQKEMNKIILENKKQKNI